MRNRAVSLEFLGRYGEAVELLRQAEERAPKDLELTLARGIAELKGGDPGAARSTFVTYRNRVGKGSPPALYYCHAVLAAAAVGELDEAVSVGREGLKLYPAEGPILVNTGAILDHKGNHEAAEQYFIRALHSGSDIPPQAHKNLGDQALRRGDVEGARSHFERAVRLDPALGDDVFLQLGIIASHSGDKDLAIMFLRRSVELNPDNEEARGRLSDLSPVP
jgi:tetratricopeptide (TPR) repeat protein